jgi:alpha-mannosidase
MDLCELVILLPCHSLEDFPQHQRGDEAAELLAGWTALWHPALLAAANRAPILLRADSPPVQLEGRLVVVPSVSESLLPGGFAERIAGEGGLLIPSHKDRRVILDQALAALPDEKRAVDSELAQDFLALAYCYLQVQVLTRQMRYSSSLDEVSFNTRLLAGAQAAMIGNEEEARSKLSACFSLLAEERDHFYAVDAFLLDLTLVAPSTLGAALCLELSLPNAVNLLLTGQLLATIASAHPETLEALRAGVVSGRVGLFGGEQRELALPLLSVETILRELHRGRTVFASLLDHAPTVFGRRRFGLTPLLPQILTRLGYRGALHATLDDGRFPQGSQIKTRWEGADGVAIDALAKAPLDASKPETFLSLGTRLGESMDTDHAATLCLAHWPGAACPWYDDLRRGAGYCNALGRFLTIEAYFRDTYAPGHLDRFGVDQYRSPYLVQAVAQQRSNPISSAVRYWRAQTALESVQGLRALLTALGERTAPGMEDLAADVDRMADDGPNIAAEERLAEERAACLRHFAQTLPSQDERPGGWLVVNPLSYPRRIGVELPDLPHPPDVERPIYATGQHAGCTHAVVDVPAMGFVRVAPGSARTGDYKGPLLAEDKTRDEGVMVLRNEFFEARIGAATGALMSLKNYESRTNRLAQQIAYRVAGPRKHISYAEVSGTAHYSRMVADRVTIARSTPAMGEIHASGRLLDRTDDVLADFQQTYRVWRGSRVVRVEIELHPHQEPAADPWHCYFACRFAWGDENAELTRGVSQTRRTAGEQRIEAPHYVEIDVAGRRTAILTGGLPYHRRVGPRMLDSLLIVRGEQERRFQIGIGFDLTHPLQEAIGLLSPPATTRLAATPQMNSGWFFHVDAKNVVATNWAPVVDGESVRGVRVRLLETAGRSARARLSCCRAITAARYLDFRGQSQGDCRIDEGRARIDITAHQWVEVEACWS